jgi:hypothetical protein
MFGSSVLILLLLLRLNEFNYFIEHPYPTLTLPLAGEGTDLTLQKVGSKVPPPGLGGGKAFDKDLL